MGFQAVHFSALDAMDAGEMGKPVSEAPGGATTAAVNIFFVSELGFGLGPFCVGLLSNSLAPSHDEQSVRYALLARSVFCRSWWLVSVT